jgi:hypothetical protein
MLLPAVLPPVLLLTLPMPTMGLLLLIVAATAKTGAVVRKTPGVLAGCQASAV